MRIAIVGTGISGLVAAHQLYSEHEITVYEAQERCGGHSNTVQVERGGCAYAIDTGFIVFNDWTYPNFIRLLEKLGVPAQPTEMSFSVSCEKSGLEYSGNSINTLFAQRGNILRASFYRMLADILRFNRRAKRFLREGDPGMPMSRFIVQEGFSRQFVEHYLVPMMAAVWSAKPLIVRDFPASHFLRFFENHGLLNISDRPQWRSIVGGSREYVRRLIAPFRERIRLASPVDRIRRMTDGVLVSVRGAEPEKYDHVVIAAHSDEALAMLGDASGAEREILGAIPYQENEAILHTDASILPLCRRAWASWNYRLPERGEERATLTYHMNTLQCLDAPEQFCVTLNDAASINPAKIVRRISYSHPVYTGAAIAAQKRRAEISGVNRTHFCGAYWGYGFHEDGVKSALAACEAFGRGNFA